MPACQSSVYCARVTFRAAPLLGLLILWTSAPQAEPSAYAHAEVAPPAVRNITRTVDSGAEAVIARATFWTSECNARGVTVTIKQPADLALAPEDLDDLG